jgi:hypothetical protein
MLSADALLAHAVARTEQDSPLQASEPWQDLASVLGAQIPAYH